MGRTATCVLGLLILLSTPLRAADRDAACLTAGQRGELSLRQGEAAAIAAIEVGPRLRVLREAQAAIDKAREAWATCEADRPSNAPADACSRERAAFQSANDALPAAEASHREALIELKTRTAARLKTVREEFPSCG